MARAGTRALICLFTAASFTLAPRELYAQGALSQIREDVRTPSEPSPSSADKSPSRRKSRKRCQHSYGCDCADDDDNWFGSLGDETLVHGRVTTGLQWHRAEVFIGYDYYEVDQTELSGFVSGLRLWF